MGVTLGLTITENSLNTATNTSNVTVIVGISWTYGSYSGFNPAGTLTIDGVAYNFNANFNYANGNGPVSTTGSGTLYTKTVDVVHDPDGTKTLEVSVSYAASSSNTVTASGSKVLTPITASGGGDSEGVSSSGTVSIEETSGFKTYTIHIDNGSTWDTYEVYIDNGTKFEPYG